MSRDLPGFSGGLETFTQVMYDVHQVSRWFDDHFINWLGDRPMSWYNQTTLSNSQYKMTSITIAADYSLQSWISRINMCTILTILWT